MLESTLDYDSGKSFPSFYLPKTGYVSYLGKGWYAGKYGIMIMCQETL